MGCFRHSLGLDTLPYLEDFEQYIVLGKPIYKVNAGFPATDFHHPVHHIKVIFNIQFLVEILHIVRQSAGKFHIHPPLSHLQILGQVMQIVCLR